jgi:pimeloyl-ACP methyl ester carboxylesterase
VAREDLTVVSGGVTLAGSYLRPTAVAVKAALVVVPGRGCVGRGGGIRLLEALAPYGVAGVAFDKRGVGQSGGNCRFATIDDFTGDALAAFEALSQRVGRDTVKLGFLGGSAGGWTVVRAAARSTAPVDFLITVAGPSVSVEAQQRENARYVTNRLGFTPAQQRQAMRYLDLMFARGNQAARFNEMQEIVRWARQVGFAEEFYDDSDIPSSPAAVDSLWVTLNDYDPAPDLRRLKLPLLAFFGEQDEVVPPKENVVALRRIAAANLDLRARIIVVPDGDHGMGVAGGVSRLAEGVQPHRFDRLSPVYLENVVTFLTELAGSR